MMSAHRVGLGEGMLQSFDISEYKLKYHDGYFDQASQVEVVLPLGKAFINPEKNHLVVGFPGADGIEFCLRSGVPGVWAFYPYEEDYIKVAGGLALLVSGWQSGSVTV